MHVVVNSDEAEVNKLNAKRKRLGRQTTDAAEEVVNAISEALMHNAVFDPVSVEVQPCKNCRGTGTINTGNAWKTCPECA